MCECKVCLFCVLVASMLIFVTCFNVENRNYAVYSSPDYQSMFGFAVAIHKDHGTGWVLIGAPQAQSSHQPVTRGGAVYKCPTDRDEGCAELPFDRRGNNIDANNLEIDNKTEQWFGATLSTSQTENGPVVACAPRYTWFAQTRKRRDPVGTCYVAKDSFTRFDEYSPCRTSHWGYHRQGSCQAGFSAAINSEGDRLFVGAPGSWYWQGQMYSIDANVIFGFTPALFGGFGSKGQIIHQNLRSRPAVFTTKEGTARDDDSYMGYSMAVGDFLNNGEQGVAVGLPRGGALQGRVQLFKWDLTNYRNFTGDQLGSYFGYAITAADVDGDKKIDLIIGAPMYTVPNNEGNFDVGRVYVIYNYGERGQFTSTYVIDGFRTKSRFGQALASLGDINQDGCADFAVGAPYDGLSERGAVYIYHGSVKGVRPKYSQVIFAEDVSSPGQYPRTFGFSISGGIDLDGNDYPDMAVGAYLSNQAYFFRSRPVVRVESFVKFSEGKLIDLKDKRCRLRDNTSVPCTTIHFCIKYSGKGVPNQLYLDVQYILDTKKLKSPRMAFIERENAHIMNNTIRLVKDNLEPSCEIKQVYIQQDIRDKLTSLEAEVKYWMREETGQFNYLQRDPRSILKPTLDLNSPPSRKDSISIKKNCGNDQICIPNLILDVSPNVQQYFLGSNSDLNLQVIVSNIGEDAFEATFEINYPEGIFLKKIVDIKTDVRILCSPSENRTIKCEIGNPLSAGKIAKFEIQLQPTYREGMPTSYEFDMFVNSTNPENKFDTDNNYKHLSIGINVESTLQLGGRSQPSDVFYNTSDYTQEFITKESHLGPQLTHVYFLKNNGPVNIEEIDIEILWPYAIGGKDLLYLLDQPYTLGNIKCEKAPTNYKHLTPEPPLKSIWEKLGVNRYGIEFTTSKDIGGILSETGPGTKGISGGELPASPPNITDLVEKSADSSSVTKTRLKESYAQENLRPSSWSSGKTGHVIHSGSDTSYQRKVGYSPALEQTVYESSAPFYNRSMVPIVWTSTGAPSNIHDTGLQNAGQQSSYNYQRNRAQGGSYQNRFGTQYSSSSYQTNNPPQSRTRYSGISPQVLATESNENGEHSQTGYIDENGVYRSYNQESINQEDEFGTAALGHGFTARVLDIGNTNQLSPPTTNTANRQQETSYNRESPGYHRNVGSPIEEHHSSSSGTRTYQKNGENISRKSWQSQQHWSNSQPVQAQSNNLERDNVPTDRPGPNTRIFGRGKREAATPSTDQLHFKCESTKCYQIKCHVGRLEPEKEIAIALRSRVSVRTLRNLTTTQSVFLSTMMLARIKRLPYIGTPVPKDNDTFTHEIITKIDAPEPEHKSGVVPLWIVVLSAVAGTLILLLLIFLLYKLGFFKRNRPSNAPERQPLQRNGYHHGDEAL